MPSFCHFAHFLGMGSFNIGCDMHDSGMELAKYETDAFLSGLIVYLMSLALIPNVL
jgi:hypothetical protein